MRSAKARRPSSPAPVEPTSRRRSDGGRTRAPRPPGPIAEFPLRDSASSAVRADKPPERAAAPRPSSALRSSSRRLSAWAPGNASAIACATRVHSSARCRHAHSSRASRSDAQPRKSATPRPPRSLSESITCRMAALARTASLRGPHDALVRPFFSRSSVCSERDLRKPSQSATSASSPSVELPIDTWRTPALLASPTASDRAWVLETGWLDRWSSANVVLAASTSPRARASPSSKRRVRIR